LDSVLLKIPGLQQKFYVMAFERPGSKNCKLGVPRW